MRLPRVACVVGPTASGKSEIADLVAEKLGGEVVSVDSMQVYRGMDIGTAKVAPGDTRVPLHMIDVADVSEPYSVARFQREARACVDDVMRRGKVAVLCGGTGLYLDAVIDEMLFPEGEVEAQRRSAYERIAREQGPDALYAMLVERDPGSAALIHPHNVRRVVRALELCDEGASYGVRNEGLRVRAPHYDARVWALVVAREVLYERIEQRVDAMFAAGLVDEVRKLETEGLRDSKTASQAIGYREVLRYLDGEFDLDECVRLVKRNTRHYAKRQLSWIRRDGRAHPVEMEGRSPEEAAGFICEEWNAFVGGEVHGAI